MPETLLKDSIVKQLRKTDYKLSLVNKSRSLSNTIKNFLVNSVEDFKLVGNNEFYAELKPIDFNDVIYTETLLSYERVKRHRKSIASLLDSDSPKAWLLVTAYYHAFFCAHIINKLLGRFLCYLEAGDLNAISSKAGQPSRYKLSPGNYVGVFFSCDGMTVTLHFKYDGEKPHMSVWKNLSDKYSARTADDVRRTKRISLFKDIIDNSVSRWPVPSDIRNMWNYKDVSLYLSRGDKIAKDLGAYLKQGQDMSWASQNRITPDESNVALSIAFICGTLDRSVEILHAPLIG